MKYYLKDTETEDKIEISKDEYEYFKLENSILGGYKILSRPRKLKGKAFGIIEGVENLEAFYEPKRYRLIHEEERVI